MICVYEIKPFVFKEKIMFHKKKDCSISKHTLSNPYSKIHLDLTS